MVEAVDAGAAQLVAALVDIGVAVVGVAVGHLSCDSWLVGTAVVLVLAQTAVVLAVESQSAAERRAIAVNVPEFFVAAAGLGRALAAAVGTVVTMMQEPAEKVIDLECSNLEAERCAEKRSAVAAKVAATDPACRKRPRRKKPRRKKPRGTTQQKTRPRGWAWVLGYGTGRGTGSGWSVGKAVALPLSPCGGAPA